MSDSVKQENISISGDGSKVVGGNDNSTTNNYLSPKTKLASLFDKLKTHFDEENVISEISESLKKYTDDQDTIGLNEKLKLANKEHLFDDFSWCKQEFSKMLVRYQNYEPAQEIFVFILAIVFEKYRNIISPMIREKHPENDILKSISENVVNPIIDLINQEGCNDIMGLTSTEIEGMFHYLTGTCRIKWDL